MPVEKKSLKSKYQEKFKDWCEQSTSHGIPSIARSTNWVMRIMWTLFFLGSLAYCSYLIIQSIIDFNKRETVISMNKIQDLPATFPAVTFCNINPFKEDEVQSYFGESNDFAKCLNITDGDELQKCFNSNNTNSILDDFSDNIKRSIANDLTLSNLNRSQLGFQFYDMWVSCTFNSKYCWEEDFEQYWSNEYGNCYTFNGKNTKDLRKTSETGEKYGLTLELIVKQSGYNSKFGYKTGLFLIVHNQTDQPFTLNSGITLPTGYETYVAVSRTFITKMEAPYSDCLKELKSENSYAKKLFEYFNLLNVSNYNQEFCYTLCYQDKLIDTCKCQDIITPLIKKNITFCETEDELFCLSEFDGNFTTSDIKAKCENACPVQCNSYNYDLRTTSATYPSLSYLKYLMTDESYAEIIPNDDISIRDFAREGMLKVIVNYDNLYYTSVEDNAKVTPESLFGNLGGQLGLFIGLSLLSFIEIIELLIEFVLIYMDHRKENNAPSNPTNIYPFYRSAY